MANFKKPEKVRIIRLLNLTQVVDENEAGAVSICHHNKHSYSVSKLVSTDFTRNAPAPSWMEFAYEHFPVPLDSNGQPWDAAVMFLLDWSFSRPLPNMRSLANIASDLAAYRHFLDIKNLDWTLFPKMKLDRPTYRFRGYLKNEVDNGMGISVARRQMGTVIRFYRWALDESILVPENEPWKARDSLVPIKSHFGSAKLIRVKSTDLQIYSPPQREIDYIYDGGKLRPLSVPEQDVLMRALAICGNTEITLMHLLAISTGARLQTVCTIRIKHILAASPPDKYGNVRIPAGPGTGIDTKGNKKGVLFVPHGMLERLKIYLASSRANRRQFRSSLGKSPEQFVFLTPGGDPYYEPKKMIGASTNLHRKEKNGERSKGDVRGAALQTYIRDYVLPVAREISGDPKFYYRFHWLRACFGMNYLDAQTKLVNEGKISLATAIGRIQERLWHESPATTMLYLDFRGRQEQVSHIQAEFEDYLESIMDLAMRGA